jgi:hypothetical protein
MATIITRLGKGSPLTWVEMDTNLTNLNTAVVGLSSFTISTQTGTSYTVVLGDVNSLIKFTNANPVSIVLPLNATVPVPVGSQIHIKQQGAGKVTVSGAGGVTINSSSSLSTNVQYSVCTLLYEGSDTWVFFGDKS